MNFKHLLAAAAATTLMAGAAHAQTMSQPADPNSSQTALPSVDSTRPTGADAGATMLPEGQVSGSTTAGASTDMSAPSASTGMSAPSATTGATTDTSASASATTVSNGPVADTPENRAKYKPLSNAGKRSAAKGN